MKFGAQVSCYLTDWDDISAVIAAMENGRWHSVYFADHFLPPNRPGASESLTAYEGFTAKVNGLLRADQHSDKLTGLLESVRTFTHRREFPAVGLMLSLKPTSTDGKREPTARYMVNSSCHLSHQGWISIRVSQNKVTQAESLSHPSYSSHSGKSFVCC